MNRINIEDYVSHSEKVNFFSNSAVFETTVSTIQSIAFDLWNNKKLQLKCITATDERKEQGCFRIWYVFGVPEEQALIIPYIRLKENEQFPSLCTSIPGAAVYEKKIHSFFGLIPADHPDLRQSILHENWPLGVYPLRKDFDWQHRPPEASGNYQFQTVEGEGIYEIPVGPIHAGIIEPGHFRFSVAGEEILLLEARLGFTHKGSEKLFEQLHLNQQVRLSEKISGDSSFSHSLAFCQGVEQLADQTVPDRARYLRVIYAELERLANHFGDVGAIMLDTGFNFGGTHGARLREKILRINEQLTGSRFLRGVNICGGVTKDIGIQDMKKVVADIDLIRQDFSEVIHIAEHSSSLMNRLSGTGTLAHQIALDFGATGVAAKAVGVKSDARVDFPYAAYGEIRLKKVEMELTGDVRARFSVRVKEITASMDLIQQAVSTIPNGSLSTNLRPFKKNAIAVSLVEGWRGEILYFLKTDNQGMIERVAPRDPSWINWSLLGFAGAGNLVPDFPLINKSFNLSYTGNDL